MLIFRAHLDKNDAHVNFILTYTSVLLGFMVGIIRAALKSVCDLSASFASQSGARGDFRTAARCPQSGALQQDSSPSFGDGVMNVLEGVVGQNGGHCRKWHGRRLNNRAAWGSSAVQWPAGGKDTPVDGRVAAACSPFRFGARRDDVATLFPRPETEFGPANFSARERTVLRRQRYQ
jgi:hypothetical protein